MKIVRYIIDGRNWGPLNISRPLPVDNDPWGELAPLRGTSLGNLIPVIEGRVLSEALHGNPYPLVRAIGPSPRDLLKRVPKDFRDCQIAKKCLMYDAKKCHPSIGMPECFISMKGGEILNFVLLTWAENGYVIIVGEGEFSLG